MFDNCTQYYILVSMKQQKKAIGIRVHPDLLDKLEKIRQEENNKTPFANVTRSSLIERAIIKYVKWKEFY